MLASTCCLLWFIGSTSLQLSLMSSMYRGMLAQVDASECKQFQVDVAVTVRFEPREPPSPGCDSNTSDSDSETCSLVPPAGRDTNLQTELTDFFAALPWEPLPKCESVCAERTADLIYSMARFKTDPCIHIMNTKGNSASWDILFRHPRSPVSLTTAQGLWCVCEIGMVVQRVVQRLPLQSDSASTSASTFATPSRSSAPVFDDEYCEPYKISRRVIISDQMLQIQAWYPKPPYTGVRSDYILNDGDWDALNKIIAYPTSCDAEVQDLLGTDPVNIQPDGLRPPHSSNCTVKYRGGDKSQSGYIGLCCEGDYMAPIIQRIKLLHSCDPRNTTFRMAYKRMCKKFDIPHDIMDIIVDKVDSKSRLEELAEEFRMRFL